MLNKIKSQFFTKILFSNIIYKNKLKLIKYNKRFQKFFDLCLTDYKIFSGRYITHEENGKVKEYDAYNNKLIFEGEYLNEKKNGKGKEYFVDGGLKFEGEYLNGKRNGKGKEYNIYNKLIFEGEYLNGKKWNGKGLYEECEIKEGKGYLDEYDDKDGYLKFVGEYLNGERNGKGKEFNKCNELIFEGEYLNGKRWNGKGYQQFNEIPPELKNGEGFFIEQICSIKYMFKLFEGNYSNGEKNGQGKEYDPDLFNGSNCDNLIYEGEYLNGKKQGKGKEYYMDDGPLLFEGEFSNNHKRKGKTYYKNGKLEYEGEYIFDKKWNGKGYNKKGNIIYQLINGNGIVREYDYVNYLLYEGEYLNGKRSGKGKEYRLNYMYNIKELIFEGEYLDGKKWSGKGYHSKKVVYEIKDGKGKAKEYDLNGKLKFEGEYLNGERNGKGKEYEYGNCIFEGEYLNGERNGKGKEYIYNYDSGTNTIIFEGEYLNGKRWNGKDSSCKK